MLLRRCIFIFASIVISASSTSALFKIKLHNDEEEPEKLPFFLGNRPRIISIFSKPTHEDAPKQTGPGILGHVGNVIHGGSIGIEIRPLAPVQGILEHAKKIIHGGKPEHHTPPPEHHTPPPEPYDPPKGGSWEEEENDKDWMPENPAKPVPVGPSWEDIGEDPEDDASIPYEEIINPRVKPRPKRHYLNSKIYHVPVKFVSNAKPFQLRFNDIWKFKGTDKSLNGVHRKLASLYQRLTTMDKQRVS